MLVLTRRLGERIMIGPDIIVSIERIDHNQVRVGIVADRGVKVLREEIAGTPPRGDGKPPGD